MRARGLLASAVAVLALAACGGGGGASSNGVGSKSPQQIVVAVQSAIRGVKSVHVAGSIVTQGQPITLDLHLVPGQGGEGQMTLSGLGFHLIVTGGAVYINGTEQFWRHFGGTAGATLFKGKWLKAPDTGSFGSFAQLTNLSALFGQISNGHGVLKKGSSTTINGSSAIAVTDTTKGGTLYVATTGQPYPIEIVKTGADGGKIIFDQFNQSVTLAAPKNAIDISKLQGA
ncbi:MAG TPA: hypothetical protein VKT31_03000 [Solirubrobacteraceae bacterium]|nr:hypothetical protein [Solirubrobacteraceae bacterium]